MPSIQVYIHPRVQTRYKSSTHNTTPSPSGFRGNAVAQEFVSLCSGSTKPRESPARRMVGQNQPPFAEQHVRRTADSEQLIHPYVASSQLCAAPRTYARIYLLQKPPFKAVSFMRQLPNNILFASVYERRSLGSRCGRANVVKGVSC